MKRVWRKVIALVLVLMMVLQMLPNSGFRSSLAADTNTATEVTGTTENNTSTKETKEQSKDNSKTETETSSETESVTSEDKTTEAASTETEETKEEVSEGSTEQKETGTTQTEETTTAASEEQTTAASSEETSASTEETKPAGDSEEAAGEETTEQEEETAKTSFTYEDNRVVITAEAGEDAAFPHNTELRADYMEPGSAVYKEAVAAVEAQLSSELKADKKNVTTDYVFYDIYFLVDGERVEPAEGKVKVTMDFKDPVLGETDGEVINTEVVHVDNNGNAEIVTDNVESNKNGKVTSASFSQSSFSPVGIAMTARNNEPPAEAVDTVSLNDGITDNKGGKITKATLEIYLDNQWMDLTEVAEWLETHDIIPDKTPVQVDVEFEMGENAFLKEDSTITYTISGGIIPTVNGYENIAMKEMDSDSGAEAIIGFYSVENSQVTIHPDNTFLEEHEWKITKGQFSFEGNFDGNWWANNDELKFGGDADVVLSKDWFMADKADVTIKKEKTGIDYSKGIISYKITVTAPSTNTMNIPNVTVTDSVVVGNNGSMPDWLVYDSVTAPQGTTISWNQDKTAWTWNIGNMTPETTYTLNYKLKLTGNHTFYDSGLGGKITNTATVKSDNEVKGSSKVETSLGESLNIKKENIKNDNQVFYYEDGKLYAEYKITVSAPTDEDGNPLNTGTVPNVTVKDIFTRADGDIEAYEFISIEKNGTVIKGEGSNPNTNIISGTDYTLDLQNKTFTWNVGDVGREDTYTLSYRVQIDNDLLSDKTGVQSSAQFDNTAELYVNNSKKGDSEVSIQAVKKWIQKTGTYDKNNNTFTFTITVNDGIPYGSAYAINEIVDELIGDFTYGNQIEVEYLYHGDATAKESGKITLSLGTTGTDVIVQDKTGTSTVKKQSWTINDKTPEMRTYLSGEYKLILTYSVYRDPGATATIPTAGNSAGVGVGTGGEPGDHWTSWVGDGVASSVVSKSYVDGGDSRTPNWKTEIPVNVYNGSTYTDTVADNELMWLTQEQLNGVTVKLKNATGTWTSTGSDPDYTITGTGEKTVNGVTVYNGFIITFKKHTSNVTTDNPIIIAYKTTIDTSKISFGGNQKYVNNGTFSLDGSLTSNCSAECTYEESTGISKSEGQFYSKDEGDIEAGTMTWYIDLDTDGKMFGDATITEMIPAGLEFEKAVLVMGTGENETEIPNSTLTEKGNSVSINIGDATSSNFVEISLKDKAYNLSRRADDIIFGVTGLQRGKAVNFRIKIFTKTSSNTWKDLVESNDGSASFKNEAVLTYDGKTDPDDATITVNKTKVTKSLTDYSSSTIWPNAEYKVVLNELGLDLGTETTSMTFTDEMTITSVKDEEGTEREEYKINGETEGKIAAQIVAGTIVVKYNDQVVTEGDTVTDTTYVVKSVADNKFELVLPDDKKIEITYQIEFNVPADWTVVINNTAFYNGQHYQDSMNNTSIQVKDATGALAGGAGTTGIYLQKTDADTGKALQGAQFKLEKVTGYNGENVQTTQVVSQEAGGLYSSDAEGKVTFAYLDKNSGSYTVLYRYTEENPPTGYQKDATPHYFAFGDNFSDEVQKFIDDNHLDVALVPGGTTFDVDNELILGQIQVTKKVTIMEDDLDEILDLIAKEDKEFTVGLYTYSDEDGGKYVPFTQNPYTQETYNPIRTITVEEGQSTGTVTYDNLPFGTYYVFELDSEGNPITSGSTVGTETDDPYMCTVTVDASESTQQGVVGSKGNGPLEIVTHYEDYENNVIPNRVTIENMYYDLPDGYSYEASILINKKLLNGSETYETNDTFYAAVFEKEEDTSTGGAGTSGDGTTTPDQGDAGNAGEGNQAGSEGTDPAQGNDSGTSQGGTGSTGGNTFEMAGETYRQVSKVLTLKNNDTYEIGVPLGGANGDQPITYYVFETDADGNPIISIDADGNITYNQPFAYDITLESTGENGESNNRGEVYVTAAGGQHEVTITNQATSVTIEKRDTDGNPLSGATLELWKESDSPDAGVPEDEGRTKAADGDVLLETWVTDGTPHVLTAELAVGGKYYLRETGIPSGYLQAADMLFTVEDGEPITVVMEDRNASYENGQIQVTKRLSTIDQETFDYVDLIAEDVTFYVGLFTDETAEHPYGADYIKEIHVQNTSSGTVTYDNLPSGTYYVYEVEQDGTVIPYREVQNTTEDGSSGFYCNGDGTDGEVKTITIDLDKENREGSTELNNVYYGTLPEGFAYQGELSITKSIIKDGAPADSRDVFYAGVFTSETEATPYKVVTLENNGTVSVEVPLGGETGTDPITYYIYETDANGNKLNKDSFAYEVSGEGTVALDKNNTSGTLTIVNTIPTSSETTRTITEREDNNSSSSSSTNRSTSSSRTGDDNRTGLWLLFFAAAAAGVIITLRKRGRHNL